MSSWEQCGHGGSFLILWGDSARTGEDRECVCAVDLAYVVVELAADSFSSPFRAGTCICFSCWCGCSINRCARTNQRAGASGNSSLSPDSPSDCLIDRFVSSAPQLYVAAVVPFRTGAAIRPYFASCTALWAALSLAFLFSADDLFATRTAQPTPEQTRGLRRRLRLARSYQTPAPFKTLPRPPAPSCSLRNRAQTS